MLKKNSNCLHCTWRVTRNLCLGSLHLTIDTKKKAITADVKALEKEGENERPCGGGRPKYIKKSERSNRQRLRSWPSGRIYEPSFECFTHREEIRTARTGILRGGSGIIKHEDLSRSNLSPHVVLRMLQDSSTPKSFDKLNSELIIEDSLYTVRGRLYRKIICPQMGSLQWSLTVAFKLLNVWSIFSRSMIKNRVCSEGQGVLRALR